MSPEDRLKEILEENTDLTDLLTGGIYTFSELGQTGLVQTNTVSASAFTKVNGLPRIRPCAVIRHRVSTPSYTRADTDTKQISYNNTVEIWYYQYSGYDTITEAADQVYSTLSLAVFTELGLILPVQSMRGLIAPEFSNTSLIRDDYQFKLVKRPV